MINKIRVDSIPATSSKGLPGVFLRRTTVFSTTTERICVLIQVSVFIVFALPVGLLSAPFPSVLKMSKILLLLCGESRIRTCTKIKLDLTDNFTGYIYLLPVAWFSVYQFRHLPVLPTVSRRPGSLNNNTPYEKIYICTVATVVLLVSSST